jgi:hypothetical protein
MGLPSSHEQSSAAGAFAALPNQYSTAAAFVRDADSTYGQAQNVFYSVNYNFTSTINTQVQDYPGLTLAEIQGNDENLFKCKINITAIV